MLMNRIPHNPPGVSDSHMTNMQLVPVVLTCLRCSHDGAVGTEEPQDQPQEPQDQLGTRSAVLQFGRFHRSESQKLTASKSRLICV